jgi:hypothetical protein
MQQLTEWMMQDEERLNNLYSLLDQLDHDQEIIEQEKIQEEIIRIQMEDEAWYAEYEEAQADMTRFLADYEAKKDEF